MKLRTALKTALLTATMAAAAGCQQHDAAPTTTPAPATTGTGSAKTAPVATAPATAAGPFVVSIAPSETPDETIVSTSERCGHLDKFGQKISTKIYEREKERIAAAHLSPEAEKKAVAELKEKIKETTNWEGELTMDATIDGTVGAKGTESKIWAFSMPKGTDTGPKNLKDKMQSVLHQNAPRVCIPYNQFSKRDESQARSDYFAINIIVSAPPPPKVIVKYVTSPDNKK